jgi:adenylate cyclase
MAKDRLSGTLAVILHADVAGSTALVQQDQQLAHERIQDSFQRFSDTIEKYKGHVLELRGDALLAEFAHASDAVSAALSFQADHASYLNQLEDDLHPTIRVGIAMGEVIIADNTVTGAGVVQAQRVEQLADPGGVCITTSIHEALSNRMSFDIENLGEKTLKGFDYQVRVYRVELRAGESILPPEESRQHDVLPKSRRLMVVAIVSFTLVIAGGATYWFKTQAPPEEQNSVENMAFPLPDKPSLVVLPFANMSDDKEQEYFVDGLTEDLITDLSRVSGLFVISRNSSFVYKGLSVDVREVSRELGVKFVLEGSVRRADNRIRVNTQLIDATTGGHIWAERYDMVIENVFDLQDDITARILSALEIKLTNKEQESAESNYTKQLDAYDSLLRGLAANGYRSREANLEARSYFEQAIEIDPGFARAYSTLANTYRVEYRNGWSTDPGQTLATAYDLAKKAIDMAGSSSQAHFVMALVYRESKDHKNAIAMAERAVELDPNYADAFVALASVLCYGGRGTEGLNLMEQAFRLNPHHPSNYPFHEGQCHFVRASYDEAIEALSRGVEQSPDSQRIHLWLAASYVLSGNQDDAEWEADIVQILNPDFTVENLRSAVPFKDPKHLETFLGALRTAGLSG